MTELTPFIKRLCSHYGLKIEDRNDDGLWKDEDWSTSKYPRYTITDNNINIGFYWSSEKTEDDFLDELKEFFIEEGKESVSYY